MKMLELSSLGMIDVRSPSMVSLYQQLKLCYMIMHN